VPAGSHRVTVWLPRRSERTLDVAVPAEGTVTASLGAE
jgi:hypothetical protein